MRYQIDSSNNASGCPHCASGWLRTRVLDDDGKELQTMAVRCACPSGGSLRRGPRVTDLLPADELEDLWPNGIPSPLGFTDDALQRAGIAPAHARWTLDAYHHELGDAVNVDRAKDWLKIPTNKRPDIVCFGPNGVGKTGLATGIMLGMMAASQTTCYIDARQLLMRLNDSYRNGAEETESEILLVFGYYELLVLDEMSAVTFTEKQRDFVRLLIDKRQQSGKHTIVILNIPDGERGTISTNMNAALGSALYDRLREKAQFWHLSGASRRKTLGGAK